MILRILGAAMLLMITVSAPARAAGVTEIEIPADARGPAFKAMVWTPCATAPGEVELAPSFSIPGVRNCPIRGSKLPLIVISHGLGGGFTSHHDTAEVLADGGYVVVALNHTLDSGFDMTRANDPSALVERPTDIRRLIDYMLRSSAAAAKIDPRRIGFFGFSRGGYTGLVLAGAVPELPRVASPPPSGYDPRLKAFVIADPLLFFPGKDSLQKVAAPLQLWSSQSGGQGVTPEKVAALAGDLPTRPEFHLVPNSTHLSFLMPCPPALAKVAGEACVDPPGFDRDAFHKQFDAQVLAFFRKSLPK